MCARQRVPAEGLIGTPAGPPDARHLELLGRIAPASNATYLATLDGEQVVYKPIAGERPLWDFPHGTLADREVAAYLVSEALGWRVVPPTWLGEGPQGLGMLQRWQEPDAEQSPVDLVDVGALPSGWCHVLDAVDHHDRPISLVHEDSQPLRRMALFDLLVNNTDRKGGHVLAMTDGHRYGVDHGITFHAEDKVRTVLWGFAGRRFEQVEIDAAARLAADDDLLAALAEHLTAEEVAAFRRRARRIRPGARFPEPEGGWPPIPWPPF